MTADKTQDKSENREVFIPTNRLEGDICREKKTKSRLKLKDLVAYVFLITPGTLVHFRHFSFKKP
jgi:hypothetical protein